MSNGWVSDVFVVELYRVFEPLAVGGLDMTEVWSLDISQVGGRVGGSGAVYDLALCAGSQADDCEIHR